jgi:branched-chain amino acid transport system substrate-binding protein
MDHSERLTAAKIVARQDITVRMWQLEINTLTFIGDNLMSGLKLFFKTSYFAAAAMAIALTSVGHAQTKSDKFKIGGVVPLSGAYAILGEDMRKGVQLAIEERGGKVLGVPIEVVWEDDETKPQPAVQKATKLISEGAHMIFGAGSSAATLAVINVTKQRKIPQLVTISTDDKITIPDGSRYLFRTSNNLDSSNRMSIAYAQQRKLKKIYAVVTDYQAMRDSSQAIRKQAEQDGIEIVGEDFTALGSRDYSSIVDKIVKSDADGVLLVLAGSDVVTFLKQAGQVNLSKTKAIFGPIAVDETVAAAVGPVALGASSGLHYHHSIENSANKKFVEAYRKKFGGLPGMNAGEAYDGMAWWLDTIEKTGSWDKEAWVDAFATSVRENSIEGKKTMRACDHQASQPGIWAEVVPGAAPSTVTMKVTAAFTESKLFPEACKR